MKTSVINFPDGILFTDWQVTCSNYNNLPGQWEIVPIYLEKNISLKVDKYSLFLPQNPKIRIVISSLVHFAKVLFENTGFNLPEWFMHFFSIGLLDFAYLWTFLELILIAIIWETSFWQKNGAGYPKNVPVDCVVRCQVPCLETRYTWWTHSVRSASLKIINDYLLLDDCSTHIQITATKFLLQDQTVKLWYYQLDDSHL